MIEPLIKTVKLKKYYSVSSGSFFNRKKTIVKAVDGVSIKIQKKETLGILGESGCGKTTLGRLILNLIKPTSGKILYNGSPIQNINPELQIIFQDPYSSLDPSMTIEESLNEPMVVNGIERLEREKRINNLLDNIGFSKNILSRYPHQFSGGQRQRIVIARALTLKPSFVVADEPVSALDVSIQAQILNLLKDLREIYSLSYLFISHDLSVVKYISDRIAVMYKGKILEEGNSDDICTNPVHPYTRLLISSLPEYYSQHEDSKEIEREEKGNCVFYHRCPFADKKCEIAFNWYVKGRSIGIIEWWCKGVGTYWSHRRTSGTGLSHHIYCRLFDGRTHRRSLRCR